MTSWADIFLAHCTCAGGSVRGRRSDASGFSVVELLVALSILVISLVALMGLASTSSFMVASSRQRSAMVNAAAGYLDRVRQEAYASVGVPGGDPAGDLAAQVTTATPYVITITPAVSWGRPENGASHLLKTVTLTVSSHSIAGGSLMSFTASAIVADVGAVGLPVASGTTTPTAVVASPANNTVVWGSSVSVVGTATVTGNKTLVWMDMLDGVQSWGSTVVSGTSAQHTWVWNTSGAREGNHPIVARATDSANNVGNSAPIVLTVDNAAPTVPGALGASFPTNATANVWWTGSTDGTDVDGLTALPAAHYVLWTYKQPADTTVAADYTKWSAVTGLNPYSQTQAPASTAPLALSGLSAFSRYALAVSASSPDRGASFGLLSNATVLTGVTECAAAGTWTVSKSGNKYVVSVSVNVPAGPTFPWTGTATTKLYRLTSPNQTITSGTLVGSVSSTYPTWSNAAVVDSSQSSVSAPTSYWWGTVTTLTPTGYGSSPVTVRSSVLASPADLTTTGSRALVFAQW